MFDLDARDATPALSHPHLAPNEMHLAANAGQHTAQMQAFWHMLRLKCRPRKIIVFDKQTRSSSAGSPSEPGPSRRKPEREEVPEAEAAAFFRLSRGAG